MHHILKTCIKLLLFVSAFLLCTTIIFVAYVYTGPRSIPQISSIIERSLKQLSDVNTVTVKDTLVQWDGIKSGVGIHVLNVQIKNPQGATLLEAPDIGVSLDIFGIILGRNTLDVLHLNNASFNLKVNTSVFDTSTAISQAPSAYTPAELAEKFWQAFKSLGYLDGKNRLPFNGVVIENSNMSLDNGIVETRFAIKEGFLIAEDKDGVISFSSRLDLITLLQEEMFAVVELNRNLNAEDFMHARIEGLSTDMLHDVFPNLILPETILGPLNLSSSWFMNGEGKLHRANATVQLFSPPVKMRAELEREEKSYLIAIDAVLDQMLFENVKQYWPENAAKNAREWVLQHMDSARIYAGNAQTVLKTNDFVSFDLKDNAFAAEIRFTGLNIRYHPELTPTLNVRGKARFDPHQITVQVDEAELGNSKLLNHSIVISDLQGEKTDLVLDGKAEGEVSDLFSFIKLNPNGAMKKNATLVKSITGNMKSDISLTIPLLDELLFSDIIYHIRSAAEEVSIPSVGSEEGVKEAAFTLETTNTELLLKGEGKIGTSGMTLDYRESYDESRSFDSKTKLSIKGNFVDLHGFGVPELLQESISGDVEIDFNGIEKLGSEEFTVAMNLTGAKLSIPEFNFVKLEGADAKFSLSGTDNGGDLVVFSSLKMESPSINAEGTMTLNRKHEQLDALSLNKVTFSDNDFSVYLMKEVKKDEAIPHYDITISGNKINLQNIINAESQEESTKRDFTFKARANLSEVVMGSGVILKTAAAQVECGAERCYSVVASGNFAEKEQMSIAYRPEGKNTFSVESNNGGALLKALGAGGDFTGGQLSVSALAEPSEIKNGKVLFKDFKVKNTPVLAKLLTIASFTGVLDILQGEGISFKKLKAEFSSVDDVISIKELKASGNSIGLTADGKLDRAKNLVDLEGAVVPAYALNNFLGNVPLIGDMLIGKEGEGVLAVRYTMKGNSEDPDITANPLSILTPGFLRGIWEGPDKAEPDVKEKPAVTKQP